MGLKVICKHWMQLPGRIKKDLCKGRTLESALFCVYVCVCVFNVISVSEVEYQDL